MENKINLLDNDLFIRKEELADLIKWVYEIPFKYGDELRSFLLAVASRRLQEEEKLKSKQEQDGSKVEELPQLTADIPAKNS